MKDEIKFVLENALIEPIENSDKYKLTKNGEKVVYLLSFGLIVYLIKHLPYIFKGEKQ